jgi:type VI secretion system FHA domain protein
MPIKVNISLSAGGRFKPVSSHTLHDKRITIGRDKECTLTLEDTQKHVSRMHVEIEEADGSYWMKVVSKVNPVIVNGKRYTYENRVPLLDGDQVTVGLYKLDVLEAEVAPPPPPKVEPPKRAVESPEDITYVARPGVGMPAMPTRLPAAPPKDVDQEEATYVPPPPLPAAPAPVIAKAPPAAPVPAMPKAPPIALPEIEAEAEEATFIPAAKAADPAPTVAKPPPPHFLLPETDGADDEVTYIKPVSTRGNQPSAMPGLPDHEEDTFSEDLTSIGRPPEKPVVMPPPPRPVPVDDPPVERPAARSLEVEPTPVKPPAEAGLDFDLSDAFGAAEEQQTAVRLPPQPPPEAEVEKDFSEDLTYVRRPPPKPAALETPPKAQAPAPAQASPAISEADRLAEEETQYRPAVQPRPAAPQVPAGRTAGSPDRAVQAFLDGAGLSRVTVSDPEKFMHETGVMVRAAVEGIMMLLLAREEARKQLGAEPEPDAGDNPLKSMADPAEIIAFLFDPQRPAIADADPVRAFAEACSDLRAHQVALFAGLRAAVLAAVGSLDPKKIEREHGVNLGGLNLTRKSKLWDISVTQYENLSRESEEEFNKVFGPEILAAYLAQVHKTRGGR